MPSWPASGRPWSDWWRALVAMGVALALLVRWRWHPALVLALGAAAALIGWVP
jgi:hypothetical protein